MNDQCQAHLMGIDPRRQTARGGPRWLVIAAVRPWVLPMFEPRGAIRDNGEPDGPRPGDEPMDRVRHTSWSGRDFQEDL
jgi:hypothetical protein